MENSQKVIMIGVGVFVTILIVGSVMALTGMGTSLFTNSYNRFSVLPNALQQQLINNFDNKKWSATQTLDYVKQYYDDTSVPVIISSGLGYSAFENIYELVNLSYVNGATFAKLEANSDTLSKVTSIVSSGYYFDQNWRTNLNVYTNPSYPSYYISSTDKYKSVTIVNKKGITIGIAFLKLT